MFKEQTLQNNSFRNIAQNQPLAAATQGLNPIQKMDEPALILATQRGDLNSFNSIVLAYQQVIFNTALYILGDADLAADAAQDTFIAAFRNINYFRGGSFKSWLMRVVTNACYDELRRQKRRPSLPLEPDDAEDNEIENPRWLADKNNTPEEKFSNRELDHAIQHCLGSLTTDLRTILVLVDIQGMNYTEASCAMHVPLGTIKSRLARARTSMRKRLQDFPELLPVTFHRKQERPL